MGFTGMDRELRLRAGATALLALVALGGVIDLLVDAPARASTFHVAYELVFIGLCLGGIVVLWRGWAAERTSLERTEADLARHAAERDAWRARAETILRGPKADKVQAVLDDLLETHREYLPQFWN